ncbi:urocortin-2 [Myotis myotis]|uniref:Urocortin 2 n=1 Tax=Myotis myotis TaxID=51298 RepID=A0A7J7UEQ8_MYOMY|nr:urocortin-2 [Myotis myotis]KAF6311417.1 urocortin 2 [Myotis myotis]
MPGWALVLLVLALGSVPLASGTPVPAPQLPPQHSPQATPRPAASESPPGKSPPASPGPRPGPRITLSLDVPLGLQQILLAQARARALREQAAANARILARMGR